MIAADSPDKRRIGAKVLSIDRYGTIRHWARSALAELLSAGDLVIANDAATLPASLFGTHVPSHRTIEVRLASRPSLDVTHVSDFVALVFGEGDFRTRTEDRGQPPALAPGDRLVLGPLQATIVRLLNHPRLVLLCFDGSAREIWAGLARHGRPVQYSHVPVPLALWDTWTPIAGPPVAFEPPSAGFALSWDTLASLAARGIQFAAITHAAGLSSTGDLTLDALLPFDEPYRIPMPTAQAILQTRAQYGRIIAIGTTVVRALEHAVSVHGSIAAGEGLATNKISRSTRLRAVDAVLTGTHERGTSHYELLRAFVSSESLVRMDLELDRHDYQTHEYGDSILVERAARSFAMRPGRDHRPGRRQRPITQ
jgi:S-adenosylmethionine:tRNA ribosyltransferase-isomerase